MKFNISSETKEWILGTLVAGVIFWLMLPVLKKDTTPVQPIVRPENIDVAITAYSGALADGQPESVLNELNASTAKDYGVRVYQDRTTGAFVATDLSGKELKRI